MKTSPNHNRLREKNTSLARSTQKQPSTGIGSTKTGLGKRRPRVVYETSAASITLDDAHSTGPATTTRSDEGPSSLALKKNKLTSVVWEDFIVSYTRNADRSEDRWGTCKQCGKRIQVT